ncbi:hypothetical protein Pve01_57960 [Planomonospora venezuelensis]|nr:hypothetical protein Pve01_57960 [Planomonospora venezuelensis]
MLDAIDEVPWDRLEHNYGTASGVPALAQEQGAADALAEPDNLLFHQGGWICSAAAAAVPSPRRAGGERGRPRTRGDHPNPVIPAANAIEHILAWSHFRRLHQTRALVSHYRRRGDPLPVDLRM